MKTVKIAEMALLMAALLFMPKSAHANAAVGNVYAGASMALCGKCHVVSRAGDGDIERVVKRRYPGARILDRDYDNGLLEVKIAHKGREKIMLFDHSGRWLRTLWEIRRGGIARKVLDVLKEKGFPYRSVDDNDNYVVENSRGRYYAVQVRKWNEDFILLLSDKGRLMRHFYDDEWNDGHFYDDGEDRFDEGDDEWDDWLRGHGSVRRDDGEDRFDEGDDEWDNRHRHPVHRKARRDDGEDHFDEGDDEWDDGED